MKHPNPLRRSRAAVTRWGLFVLVGVAITPAAAPAKTISSTAVFAATGRSLFNSGSAVTFDTGAQHLGPAPIDLGDTVGAIIDPCPVFSCKIGAEVGAELKANVGLDYGVKLNSGSFDAQYPVNLTLAAPDDLTNAVNHTFTIQSSYNVGGYNSSILKTVLGKTVSAQLQTHSPTVQAFVNLDAKFSAFVGAEACAVFCIGPALNLPEVDQSQPIVAVNLNNDGILRIAGQVVNLNQRFSALDGALTAQLNPPNIDARASKGSGSTAGDLRTGAADNIATLDVNISDIVSKALGVPLVGNISGIGYNLLSANAGLALQLRQTLDLKVTPYEDYNFLTPVRQVFGDGTLGGLTNQLIVPLGQAINLRSSALSLGVVPTTTLVATLSNATDLIVQGNASVQALAADIFGLHIGPLYDSGDATADLFGIPLFSSSFDVPFDAITGTPFNIRQGIDFSTIFEPGKEALLAVLGQPSSNSAVATEILSRDLTCVSGVACAPVHYADGSLLTFASDGTPTYLASADAVSLPGNTLGQGSTPEQQLALLESLGFTGVKPQFNVPPGEANPFTATPEPETWLLMLGGLGAIGAAARRHRARRTGVATVAERH